MTLKEYKEKSLNRLSKAFSNEEQILDYASHKLISETGEAIGALMKIKYHSRKENLIEELGDMLYYIVIAEYVLATHNLEEIDIDYANAYNQHDMLTNLTSMINKLCLNYITKHSIRLIVAAYNAVLYFSGLSLSSIMEYNDKKLQARHGDVFNDKWYTDRPRKQLTQEAAYNLLTKLHANKRPMYFFSSSCSNKSLELVRVDRFGKDVFIDKTGEKHAECWVYNRGI